MKFYKYIKMILILTPIVGLAFLFYKDFNPAGYLKVDYDFCHPTPFVSKLSPHGRVLDVQKNGNNCYQTMVIDPVYFDVRLPQRFQQVKLKIWYKKAASTPLFLGVAQNIANWQWRMKEIVYQRSFDGWQLGSAVYNLSSIVLDKHNLRFIISSPQLNKDRQQIIFKHIQIEFFTAPLSSNNFWSRCRNWLQGTNLYYLIKQF